MKFTPIEPHENLDLLAMASKTGKWELGFRSVLYGICVSLSFPEDREYIIDYYCGMDAIVFLTVFEMTKLALLDVDESVESSEIKKILPTQTCRPIANDSECCDKLINLGVTAGEKYPEEIKPVSLERCSKVMDLFKENRQKLVESWGMQ